MIGALSGTVQQQSGEQLIIDVHGVGYLVTASARVLSERARDGQELRLIVHTDVKENAITLYGFADQLERRVFLLLKRVKGIGSRLALNILSGIGAEQLLRAIGAEDYSVLQGVTGIGKKTAQRIVVELREYVGELAYGGGEEEGESARTSGGSNVLADAALALEKLGFSGERSRLAVTLAARELPEIAAADAGELLRRSLVKLSG